MLTYNSESFGQDELFVSFDHMVDEDPQLWKVETIGDAFMVGWQANAYTITITKCCTKSIAIAKLCKFLLSLSLLHIVVNSPLQVAAGLNIDSAASVRDLGLGDSESELVSNCENYSKLSVSRFKERPSQKSNETMEERAPHRVSDCVTCAQV